MMISGNAEAQEPQEDPRYIVQEGDSLFGISARFGVSVEELAEENDLSDPNQIFPGMELVLPGVDWISGLLISNPMPFGENLRSLSRKYNISSQDFARLNRVSTPEQLFVNYPLILPTERGEELNTARATLAPHASLLEMAVQSGSNPWSIVGANLVENAWSIVPGDVLIIPGTDDPGPGALPSPITQLEVGFLGFVQGKTSSLIINSEALLSLSGELMGSELNFFDDGAGSLVAMQGIHALAEIGYYQLRISGALENGESFEFEQTIRVADGGYSFETITVDPALLDPEVSASEDAQIIALVSNVTEDKLWQGYFLAPTQYGDTFNSFFGTRRSYNGSDFDYYHSGLDFGGGLGVEILAPAVGEVIFAGALEIRGNITIINHGWGIYTGYFHQSEVLVEVGDIVQPGQVIGIVGNTGRSSGAHLHWEIWVGGIQVDPLDWLSNVFP